MCYISLGESFYGFLVFTYGRLKSIGSFLTVKLTCKQGCKVRIYARQLED